ncbi:MAG: putative ABC transporter permease, partial [Candidatus Nomurabacteria bacterium]|nr:putative ABC transporter permease [Candidatus Nomurabacteria bacterium]
MASLPKSKPLVELPPAPHYEIRLKSFKFWRDSFLIFWLFSFFGHLMEYVWLFVLWEFGAPPDWQNIPFFVIAAPYGFGALAILWFIYPQIVRHKLKVFDSFILSAIATTIIEFTSALVIVIALGHNPYWNYSDQPFNLFGFVCLRNSVAFGLVSLLFIYILFPYTAIAFKRLGNARLNYI